MIRFCVDDSHFRAGNLMCLDDFRQIHIAYHVGRSQYHIFAAAPVNVFHVVLKEFGIVIYKIAKTVIE